MQFVMDFLQLFTAKVLSGFYVSAHKSECEKVWPEKFSLQFTDDWPSVGDTSACMVSSSGQKRLMCQGCGEKIKVYLSGLECICHLRFGLTFSFVGFLKRGNAQIHGIIY